MLSRVELKSKADEAHVYGYLRKVKLTTAPRSGSVPAGLGLLEPSSFIGLATDRPIQNLQLVAILASRNPPWLGDLAAAVPGVLECAGINSTSQTYTPKAGVNVTQAWNTRSQVLSQYELQPDTHQFLSSDWAMPNTSIIGGFNNSSAIVARSYWQTYGSLWKVAQQAIYAGPVVGKIALPANKSSIVTFVDGKPPIKDVGFWSLTAYNANGGLVANSYGIEQVGSVGNLAYPNGQLVYGANNTMPSRAPFEVLLQSAEIPPPSNWTGNWLPIPAGGNFQLPMRFYVPEKTAIDGSYTWPVIGLPIDAIRS